MHIDNTPTKYLLNVHRLLSEAIENSSDYMYHAPCDDLQRKPKLVARAILEHDRDIQPWESVHYFKPYDEFDDPITMVFRSRSEHRLFHDFNPLKQSLERTNEGNFIIRSRKQAIKVDAEQRKRAALEEQGINPDDPNWYRRKSF